jgi:hypothetical protein
VCAPSVLRLESFVSSSLVGVVKSIYDLKLLTVVVMPCVENESTDLVVRRLGFETGRTDCGKFADVFLCVCVDFDHMRRCYCLLGDLFT